MRGWLRGLLHGMDSDMLKWVHKRATEVMKRQEHLCCEDRLSVGVVQPAEEKASEKHCCSHSVFRGCL